MKKTIIFILITICLSNVIAGPTDSKLQASKAVVVTDQNTDIGMLTLVIVFQCNVDEYRNFKLTSAFISTFTLNTEITDTSEIFKAITERKDIKQLDLPSLKRIVNKVNLSQVHINFLIKDKIIRRMVATGLVSPDDFANLTELELKTLEILSRNNLFHDKTDHKSFTLAQVRLLNSDHLNYLAQNSTKLKNGEYSIEAFIQEYSQIQPIKITQKEEQEEQQKEDLIKQAVAERLSYLSV